MRTPETQQIQKQMNTEKKKRNQCKICILIINITPPSDTNYFLLINQLMTPVTLLLKNRSKCGEHSFIFQGFPVTVFSLLLTIISNLKQLNQTNRLLDLVYTIPDQCTSPCIGQCSSYQGCTLIIIFMQQYTPACAVVVMSCAALGINSGKY